MSMTREMSDRLNAVSGRHQAETALHTAWLSYLVSRLGWDDQAVAVEALECGVFPRDAPLSRLSPPAFPLSGAVADGVTGLPGEDQVTDSERGRGP